MAFASRSSFALGVDEVEGIVAGGFAGAVLGGALLQLIGPEYVERLGAAVGTPGLWHGWVVLLVVGILLAVPFVWFVDGSINQFVNQIIALSRRSSVLQRILVPLLQRSAYGVTLYSLGQVYGLIVGVAYIALLPIWLGVVGTSPGYALHDLLTLIPWLVYGSNMGLVYGLRLSS